MKRLFLILLCLAFWLPAGASMVRLPYVQDVQAGMVIGSGGGGGSSNYTTAFEGSIDGSTYTFGTGDYAPSGATSATLASDFEITTCPSGFGSGNCGHYVDQYDSFSVTTSSDQDFDPDECTIEFDFRYVTWANTTYVYYVEESGDNNLYVMMYSDNELRLRYEGNTSSIFITTDGADLAPNTNYHVTAKMRISDNDPNLSIEVNSVTATSNTNLTEWSAAADLIRIGAPVGGYAAEFWIDNLEVVNSWN